MGLDGIEIIMEVEDRFGITISDNEAQSLLTVGNLLHLINSRIATAHNARCPSLAAFLRIRQITRECLEQPGLRIRPSTAIAAVVPLHRRAQLWRALGDVNGTSPPFLRRPKLLRYALVAVAAVAIMLGLSTATFEPAMVPLGLFAAGIFIVALYVTTSLFRVVPPTKFSTFGDATRRLVGLSSATEPTFTETDVLQHVRQICVEILGVKAADVVPTARFVQDLGLQ
ncbi:MAG: acyl carrier protein [Pirellulales bacterium]|jgi:acyl carrier protein|nr:acyl carrier protein [Pirellulales bacterium]